MNFFVGESRWQELHNTLSPKSRERYHRFNIELYGNQPELDDVKAIANLEQQARSHAATNDMVRQCADNLLAALFYLELDTLPQFNRTVFVCKAVIRCRLPPSHKALRALVMRLKDTRAQFYMECEQSVPCINTEIYQMIEGGAPFAREITFSVLSLDDVIDIKIDGITKRARSISNCPYQMRTLIKDQGLDCVFGSRKSRKRIIIEEQGPSKRVRVGR